MRIPEPSLFQEVATAWQLAIGNWLNDNDKNRRYATSESCDPPPEEPHSKVPIGRYRRFRKYIRAIRVIRGKNAVRRSPLSSFPFIFRAFHSYKLQHPINMGGHWIHRERTHRTQRKGLAALREHLCVLLW
jgi:hypothetical protein